MNHDDIERDHDARKARAERLQFGRAWDDSEHDALVRKGQRIILLFIAIMLMVGAVSSLF